MAALQTQDELVEGRDYLIGRGKEGARYLGIERGTYRFARFAGTMGAIARTALDKIHPGPRRAINSSQTIGWSFLCSSGFPFIDEQRGKKLFKELSEKLMEEPK